MTTPIDRLSPTIRPERNAIGYHGWSDLLFVHWRVPAKQIAPLLPQELTVDTWEGDAWVGLVPFYMSKIRPWWAPPVPGVSWFCETNVRTYVHYKGRDPGVWFFSLDASNSLAVRVARWRWHLPYYRAAMSIERNGSRLKYASRRLWPEPAGVGCRIDAEIGPLLGAGEPARELPAGRALPGTLEHFLIERYILYAQPAPGKILSGRVFHTPYPVREARVIECEESLLNALGIPRAGTPCHAAYSERVGVDIFPLGEIKLID